MVVVHVRKWNTVVVAVDDLRIGLVIRATQNNIVIHRQACTNQLRKSPKAGSLAQSTPGPSHTQVLYLAEDSILAFGHRDGR